MTSISIVIKTLNEEANIARAIESCLAATRSIDTEIIVADSGSTDRTIKIASEYPVIVVQVRDRREGRCGAGPQLGFQFSTGAFIYVLDGDMELNPDFLPYALQYMAEHPDVGGFGGEIVEMRINNLEFESRKRRSETFIAELGDKIDQPHAWTHLAGGALYRRTAIEDVGYLSDRNLRGNEEYDLAARLRLRGWKVISCNRPAANHYSYDKGTFALVWHRLRSGMVLAVGQIVQAGVIGGFAHYVLGEVRIVRIALAVLGFWITLLALAFALSGLVPGVITVLAGLAALVGWMALRKRSATLAAYSVFSWHVAAAGLLLGLFARRADPRRPIDAIAHHAPAGRECAEPHVEPRVEPHVEPRAVVGGSRAASV